jgi:hypothetical protein
MAGRSCGVRWRRGWSIRRVLLATALCRWPFTALYLWLAPQTKGAVAVLAFTGFIVYTDFPCRGVARIAIPRCS